VVSFAHPEVGGMNASDSRLLKFYEKSAAERARLVRREGQLEFVRTKELLDRFLPRPRARMIDVGGGTGAYSSWLASLGHSVHLLDIVPAHVEEASRDQTFTAVVGDARALPVSDASYDAALLLGPLYDLPESEDRLQALPEARGVVRAGGIIVAAFICPAAAALDEYVKGWVDNPGAFDLIREQLQDGVARSSRGGFSAVSYFHWPSEIRVELASCGFETVRIFGVEGPGWVASDFDDRWSTPEGRRIVLESARTCEEHLEHQVLSAHLLAFCGR
jgi:ubiquinone/menaquinone biosynthesis C-methylase UbiE